MRLSGPVLHEAESADYGACRFRLEGRDVVFRAAKITPTKLGQFFTLWKRAHPGAPIAPLDADDAVDLLVVSTASATQHGLFIFDKRILVAKGLLSGPQHAGKRALRVYPPWSEPVAQAAVKTQQWQLPYFIAMADGVPADPVRLRRLLGGPENHETQV